MQNIRFDIRKAAQRKAFYAGSPDAKLSYDSLVEVSFTINALRYGRYATGIRTFRGIWDGRKAQRVSAESKALINQLASYQELIEAAHDSLLQKGGMIDGEAIMNAIKQQMPDRVSLEKLYEEFLSAKKVSVEPNQHKRKPGQIAPQTLLGYPKRWAMISLYLQKKNRPNLPLGAIDRGFTINLKEFLLAYRFGNGEGYALATVNKAISFLKQLITYAQDKGYVRENPVTGFSCRGGSAANPKPLTEQTLNFLENCPLSHRLRLICDSWLIAGELCLHYADYKKLPTMRFITHQGRVYIQNERSKQEGSSLVQTVNVTARAARLLEKWGGPQNLYYKTSGAFSSALKQIAYLTNLTDSDGKPIDLSFGQGRDTGLTSRARQGANAIQLSNMAGWSNPREARRYLGDALGIVAGFVDRSQENPPAPTPDPGKI